VTFVQVTGLTAGRRPHTWLPAGQTQSGKLGGNRQEADMAVRWDEKDVQPLDGKVAVVTGANSGLGMETAIVLARHGAKLLMACRNVEKAQAAAAKVRADAKADVEIVPLDLASLASVEACAKQVSASEEQLDILVNNAGLMAVDKGKTEEGFEMQFGVNHLGHFALTAHLAPLILATPRARVVNVSSMGHRAGTLRIDDLMFEKRGYNRWQPYFQSKLANILFTAELQRRLTEAGSTAMALAAHPGSTATDLGYEGSGITNKLIKPVAPLMQPGWLGALPIVRAAVDPDARGGQYYGPQFFVRGYPRVEVPSRAARNAADARRLWDASEELTGVEFQLA
jgi:protochlorophyllide reductase